MANRKLGYGTSDKWLYFEKTADDTLMVRADSLLYCRKAAGATIDLLFDAGKYDHALLDHMGEDAAASSWQVFGRATVNLASASGKSRQAFKDIVKLINTKFSEDDPAWKRSQDAAGFIVVADAVAGVYATANITGVNTIYTDRQQKIALATP